MMRFAWTGYRQYAWGSNELKPISKTGHSQSVFGGGDMGASIVDAIDTLWLMGLKDEYDEARKWIELSFDLSRSTVRVLLLPHFFRKEIFLSSRLISASWAVSSPSTL